MSEAGDTDVESADLSVHPTSEAPVSRFYAPAGAVASALLLGVCAYAGSVPLGVAYLLSGLVLAGGWPMLLGLQRERSSAVVLAIGVLSMTAVVTTADNADGIRWVTAALAISLALVFLQSLIRRDGREQLVVSLSAMSLGLGVLASGAFLADAALRQHGREAVVAALAGAAIGAVLDATLGRRTHLAEWSLPASLVLGVAAGVIAARVAGVPWNAPLVAGLLGAGVHALRAILAAPAGRLGSGRSGSMPAQLALGVGSVLFVGVLPTSAAWLFAHLT